MAYINKNRDDDGGLVMGKLSSVKKILPAVPNMENSSKILERTENKLTSQTYGPFFLEYSLMAEYVMLQKQRIAGVYVIPSAGSPLKWFGVIFVREGLYSGGIFKFILYIPDNYPDCECPILVLDPPVFHPLVNIETGELDIKRAFVKWKRNVNHLWEILLYTKRIFYKIDPRSPLNPEAAVIYEKDLNLFKYKVTESISSCNSKLYEKPVTDDPHVINFSPWNPKLHEEVRRKLLMEKRDQDKNISTGGYSWVQPGSQRIFSKSSS